jgi:hypothetical protein
MPSENDPVYQNDSPPTAGETTVASRHSLSSVKVDRLLSRISDRYPCGIPSYVLAEAKERHISEVAGRKRVLFLVASAAESISDEERVLLTSIVEKGLGLTIEQVAIQVCELSEHGNELTEWLHTQSNAVPSIVVVAMGFQQSPHGSWTGEDPQFLHTVSLTEVLSSKESKRLFWGHLQGVISRLKVEEL